MRKERIKHWKQIIKGRYLLFIPLPTGQLKTINIEKEDYDRILCVEVTEEFLK
jgi:hypothetical protein